MLYLGTQNPKIEVIHGFKRMDVCNTAGERILAKRNPALNDFACIIIDNNNLVEQE
jgi:hypothetical protein